MTTSALKQPHTSGTSGLLRHVSNAVRCLLLFMVVGSRQAASAATVTATYDASTDVPVTADGYAATDNNVNFTLNFAPQTGTELMVVRRSCAPAGAACNRCSADSLRALTDSAGLERS